MLVIGHFFNLPHFISQNYIAIVAVRKYCTVCIPDIYPGLYNLKNNVSMTGPCVETYVYKDIKNSKERMIHI